MPKKKYTPTTKTKSLAISFDGNDRYHKTILRTLISTDLMDRSKESPVSIFTLAGAECTDIKLFQEQGLNMKTCVSVEIFKHEYEQQLETIKSFSSKYRKNTHPYHETIRRYFSEKGEGEGKTPKDKRIFLEGFDALFLDYISSYDPRMIQDIETLSLNRDILYPVMDRTGSVILYLTVSDRYQDKNNHGFLQNIADEYSHLCPKVDENGYSEEEAERLNEDSLRAHGIHFHLSNIFLKQGIRCEQIHSIYYKDGNRGTRMLFLGWKLTKIESNTTDVNAKGVELLSPLPPVYMGFRNRKDHKPSIQWLEDIKRDKNIHYRDDKYSRIAEMHENVGKKKKQVHTKLNKLFSVLGQQDNALREISEGKTNRVIAPPMDRASKLALIEAGIIKKPKSITKEDWGKMIVAIYTCLKSHKGPVAHSTLVKSLLNIFPEYKSLQNTKAGKLNQSKLTNAMAWAKAALKQGGYTISKKDCIAGEILKLTEKGLKTNLNRAAANSWQEHYTLVKRGQL